MDKEPTNDWKSIVDLGLDLLRRLSTIHPKHSNYDILVELTAYFSS